MQICPQSTFIISLKMKYQIEKKIVKIFVCCNISVLFGGLESIFKKTKIERVMAESEDK